MTHKLADDMDHMRRDIVKVYNEELCDRVERSALVKLSSNLSALKGALDKLETRIGLEISVDPYSGRIEN